jgi:hypothetical protein
MLAPAETCARRAQAMRGDGDPNVLPAGQATGPSHSGYETPHQLASGRLGRVYYEHRNGVAVGSFLNAYSDHAERSAGPQVDCVANAAVGHRSIVRRGV